MWPVPPPNPNAPPINFYARAGLSRRNPIMPLHPPPYNNVGRLQPPIFSARYPLGMNQAMMRPAGRGFSFIGRHKEAEPVECVDLTEDSPEKEAPPIPRPASPKQVLQSPSTSLPAIKIPLAETVQSSNEHRIPSPVAESSVDLRQKIRLCNQFDEAIRGFMRSRGRLRSCRLCQQRPNRTISDVVGHVLSHSKDISEILPEHDSQLVESFQNCFGNPCTETRTGRSTQRNLPKSPAESKQDSPLETGNQNKSSARSGSRDKRIEGTPLTRASGSLRQQNKENVTQVSPSKERPNTSDTPVPKVKGSGPVGVTSTITTSTPVESSRTRSRDRTPEPAEFLEELGSFLKKLDGQCSVTCVECDDAVSVSGGEGVERHVYAHLDRSLFTCRHCDVGHCDKEGMKEHVRTKHPGKAVSPETVKDLRALFQTDLLKQMKRCFGDGGCSEEVIYCISDDDEGPSIPDKTQNEKRRADERQGSRFLSLLSTLKLPRKRKTGGSEAEASQSVDGVVPEEGRNSLSLPPSKVPRVVPCPLESINQEATSEIPLPGSAGAMALGSSRKQNQQAHRGPGPTIPRVPQQKRAGPSPASARAPLLPPKTEEQIRYEKRRSGGLPMPIFSQLYFKVNRIYKSSISCNLCPGSLLTHSKGGALPLRIMEHVRIHHGGRLYSCLLCHYEGWKIKSHLVHQHKKSAEKPFWKFVENRLDLFEAELSEILKACFLEPESETARDVGKFGKTFRRMEDFQNVQLEEGTGERKKEKKKKTSGTNLEEFDMPLMTRLSSSKLSDVLRKRESSGESSSTLSSVHSSDHPSNWPSGHPDYDENTDSSAVSDSSKDSADYECQELESKEQPTEESSTDNNPGDDTLESRQKTEFLSVVSSPAKVLRCVSRASDIGMELSTNKTEAEPECGERSPWKEPRLSEDWSSSSVDHDPAQDVETSILSKYSINESSEMAETEQKMDDFVQADDSSMGPSSTTNETMTRNWIMDTSGERGEELGFGHPDKSVLPKGDPRAEDSFDGLEPAAGSHESENTLEYRNNLTRDVFPPLQSMKREELECSNGEQLTHGKAELDISPTFMELLEKAKKCFLSASDAEEDNLGIHQEEAAPKESWKSGNGCAEMDEDDEVVVKSVMEDMLNCVDVVTDIVQRVDSAVSHTRSED